MPLMSTVVQTHPIVVSMPMRRSDDHWLTIEAWFVERSLDVIWASNVDSSGMAPNPYLRHFCFKEADKEAAMLFKLTWV
jgi:hypothetical protein